MTSPKNIIKNLFDEQVEIFVSRISPKKIYEFVEECKKRHLKNNIKDSENRINFPIFTTIMKYIWRDKIDEYNIIEPLLERIFNRFKAVKVSINCENFDKKEEDEKTQTGNKPKRKDQTKYNYYYVNELNTDDKEVDVYEIAIVFTVFIKCSFREKMEVLFNITDVDNDGYINKKEITKLIHSVNYIFADEQSPIQINSSLISQSLSTIKAKDTLNKILEEPGRLNEIFTKEKYILFEELMDSIIKIPNYKFIIIPKINIEDSLNIKKKEMEITVSKKDLKEYLDITGEIISATKNANKIIQSNLQNLILTNQTPNAMDKNIKYKDKQHKYPKIESKVKKNHSNEKSNSIYLTQISSTKALAPISELNSNGASNPAISLLPIQSLFEKKKKKPKNLIVTEDITEYKVGYEKLAHLDVTPGIIKFKDSKGMKLFGETKKEFVPIGDILKRLEEYTYNKGSDIDNQLDKMKEQKGSVVELQKGQKNKMVGNKVQFSMSFLDSQSREYKPKKKNNI